MITSDQICFMGQCSTKTWPLSILSFTKKIGRSCYWFFFIMEPYHWCLINRRWWYNCQELHVNHNICITKILALSSYFLYLHGFLSTLFPIQNKTISSRTDSFQCSVLCIKFDRESKSLELKF